jgi:hypothetical protein
MPEPPSPSRQITFHQLLVAARRTCLSDALSDALKSVDPGVLKRQLTEFVPADVQQILASAGVRDEHVFAVPVVIEAKPTLVGYYRLLLGVSQKRFYVSGSGFGAYKSLELRGFINQRRPPDLAAFCRAMNESLAELVRQLSPPVTTRDVSELAILTLGAQFQGGKNNTIGQRATTDVFLAITEIVRGHITVQEARRLTLLNSSGRTVIIALASDPDIRIQEDSGGALRNKSPSKSKAAPTGATLTTARVRLRNPTRRQRNKGSPITGRSFPRRG